MAARRKPAAATRPRIADPFRDLEVGHCVLLSPAYIDPVHWFYGTVLWIDDGREEILVRQDGIAGASPHNQLHPFDYVRGFGTTKQCVALKTQAERTGRQAARQVAEIEDLAGDLRRRLQEVFETLAADVLKKCGSAIATTAEEVARG